VVDARVSVAAVAEGKAAARGPGESGEHGERAGGAAEAGKPKAKKSEVEKAQD